MSFFSPFNSRRSGPAGFGPDTRSTTMSELFRLATNVTQEQLVHMITIVEDEHECHVPVETKDESKSPLVLRVFGFYNWLLGHGIIKHDDHSYVRDLLARTARKLNYTVDISKCIRTQSIKVMTDDQLNSLIAKSTPLYPPFEFFNDPSSSIPLETRVLDYLHRSACQYVTKMVESVTSKSCQ